ncbi:unnamed protein product [Caenorhabditis angaria]|uniref:7TM GPCR serpentine receptor class x (Srx) domain-containing protein n=1 Tax=Caenorhabditis angaria TaxID=860376 RepID=A0A9P1IMU0_9PELO|nr:unnamed protein product [Caenorhabditis angaria]
MNQTFLTLHDISRPTTIIISYITCVISTVINILGIYLIRTQSGRETKLYKNVLIFSQIAFYIPQTFWGLCLCAIPLLPFPAILAHGLLKNIAPVWMMGAIWGAMFPFYMISMLAVLLVRLNIIVRVESAIRLKPITQISIIVIYLIILIIVLELTALKLNFSQKSMEDLIRLDYPEYFNITQIYGVLIFSDPSSLITLMYTIILVVSILVIAFSFVRYAIYYEIKMQVNKMSNRQQKYHKKMAKDSAVQVLVKTACFATYGIWVTLTSLMDRDFNSIPLTSIFHTMLVGSPIPGTIIMFFQNTAYLNRIKQLLGFKTVAKSTFPNKRQRDYGNIETICEASLGRMILNFVENWKKRASFHFI